MTFTIDFFNAHHSTTLFLDSLYDLTTRANDSSNKLFGYTELLNAWSLGLEVGTNGRHSLLYLAEDVHTTLTSLCQSTLQDFVAQAVYLDVHLGSGDTIAGTRYLKVHITEVVFVPEDIRENGIICSLIFTDKPHGNTRNRLFDLYPGIHQSKCAGTNRCHRRRTIGLENVADYTYYVGVFVWDHTLEGTEREVSMTDLAATRSALWTSLSCREGREVVVEEKTLFAAAEYIVYQLFVGFGSEGYRCERLSFSTSEDSRAVRHR